MRSPPWKIRFLSTFSSKEMARNCSDATTDGDGIVDGARWSAGVETRWKPRLPVVVMNAGGTSTGYRNRGCKVTVGNAGSIPEENELLPEALEIRSYQRSLWRKEKSGI